jgi:hypothetical protein
MVGFGELLHINHYFTPFCINRLFSVFVFMSKTKIMRLILILQLFRYSDKLEKEVTMELFEDALRGVTMLLLSSSNSSHRES